MAFRLYPIYLIILLFSDWPETCNPVVDWTSVPAMNNPTRTLIRHLAWIVALKLLVLLALWAWLIRPHRVAVQSEETSNHLIESAETEP